MNKFETNKLANILAAKFAEFSADKMTTNKEELVAYDAVYNAINERASRELKEIYGLDEAAVEKIMASESTEVLVKSSLAQVATIEWFGNQNASNEEELADATKVFSQWSIEVGIGLGSAWFSDMYMSGLIKADTYFKGMQFGWLSREVLLDSMTNLKQPTVASYISKAKEMNISPDVQAEVPHFASVMASYTV